MASGATEGLFMKVTIFAWTFLGRWRDFSFHQIVPGPACHEQHCLPGLGIEPEGCPLAPSHQ